MAPHPAAARKSSSGKHHPQPTEATSIRMPTKEELLAACNCNNNGTATTTLICQILDAVVAARRAGDLDAEVQTAAQASEVLIAASSSKAFAPALATAVWWHVVEHHQQEQADEPAEASLASHTSFCSVLKNVLDAAAESDGGSENANATNSSNSSSLLATQLLRTVPDTKLLQAILPDQVDATVDRKLRLTNTTVFYRQKKFNLLAEESEGYSKFLYLLLWSVNPSHHNNNDMSSATSTTLEHISTLTGTFSLDPNRCLDLTLDVLEHEFENQPEATAAVSATTTTTTKRLQFLAHCLHHLNGQTGKLPPLLGFKLRGRQDGGAASSSSSSSSSSSTSSLLKCMAWLCTFTPDAPNNEPTPLLDPAAAVPYLPENSSDKKTTTFAQALDAVYRERQTNERARVRALARVRLTGDGDNDKNSGSSTAETAAAATDVKREELQGWCALQWTRIFLERNDFSVIEPVWQEEDWSKFAVLFPDTIGVAILDWVMKEIHEWTVGSPPWSASASNELQPPPGVTIDSALEVISKPLEYTEESGCIALRPVLFTQLCRLFAALLKRESPSVISEDLDSFLRYFLVPSLSAFPTPNPALSMEVWNVIEQLPYRTRYSLYRSWRGSGLERDALKSTDKPLWLVQGELQSGKDARYALKRLSKDTIRDMSRAVAKCCHGHPLVVFTTILNQIESYDNLVQVMVDACRFVTPLSLDVLGFCILQRLSGSAGGVNRSRLKENGVNVSQWLQSLENFTGAFYKRFPYTEFQGILCYLLNRVKDGHVMELGVLRTLLKSSGGWSFADYAPAASLSATQLIGRAGSTMLKRETMAFGVVDDINLRASNEVRRVLQTDSMGASLLILLAKVRQQVVFDSSGRPKPVKLIGNLVDTCQAIMAILLDFLTNSSDGKEEQTAVEIRKFAASLPTLAQLHDSFKVDVASAWMLCRPLIRAAMSSSLYNDDLMEGDEGDVLNKFKITNETRKCYNTMLPAEAWSHLSVDLFEFFFSNSLHDLFCPEDVYVSETARLDKETERLSQKKTIPQPPPTVQPGAPPEKTDQEELERVKRVAIRLSSDYVEQKAHVKSIYAEMKSTASEFFVSEDVTQEAAVTFFVRCIYPRCMQGPDDALYCAHFVKHLHENETPGFSTLHFFDTLLVLVSRALFCLTEGEAACASILLLETWKTVSRWRYDDSAFDTELSGKPGSFMVAQTDESSAMPTSVSKEDYKHLYNKWHAAIGAACIGCLRSKEYMHLRNCLVVLTRIVEVYPTRPKLANRLIETLEPLQDESNTLADIRASAQAYSMQLLKARDDGVWKEEDAATVQARHEKEEAAAAARQKKAEERMAEIGRDSENITEQIGTSDYGGGRDRSRGRGPGRPDDHGGGRGGPPGGHERDDHPQGGGRRPPPPGVEERRNLGIRPPPPPRDPNQLSRHGPSLPPAAGVGGGGGSSSDRWQRDRGPNAGSSNTASSYAIMDATRGGSGRHEEGSTSRNLEGRWQRPDGGGGTSGSRKRSRTSSPVEQGESHEMEAPSSAKRSRRSDDDGGGGRSRRGGDDDGRGSGSRRRGRR